MNRMERLLNEMREASGDNWTEFRSHFGLDDEGMGILASGTHFGSVEDMLNSTPLEVYQNDPEAFLVALRSANSDLSETPDDEIISAISQPTDTFNSESLRCRRYEDSDPYGDWGPAITELGISQTLFDAIAAESGFGDAVGLITEFPSPVGMPEDIMNGLLDSIMTLAPNAQGRSREEVKALVFQVFPEFNGPGPGPEGE